MERLTPGRVYTEREAELIADFVLVMRDLHKYATNPVLIGTIWERHDRIVEECIDAGLTGEICGIRDNWERDFGTMK